LVPGRKHKKSGCIRRRNAIWFDANFMRHGIAAHTQRLRIGRRRRQRIGQQPGQRTGQRRGDQVLFANDGVIGEELWKSDCTAAGTQLLKDICRGV